MELKNTREQIKAVLFDMDGVLVDSEKIMLKSAIIALKRWGVNAKPDDFTPFIGAGEVAYLGGVSSLYGVPYDFAMNAAAYEVYGELINSEGASIAFPEAADVVRYLKSKGYKTAVCTSADRMKLGFNLKALGCADAFDALVTGEDITRNKPNPDIYLKGAELVGVAPENCLVAEDAKNGILAAVSAGMVPFGITTSFDEKTLRDAGASYISSTVAGLKELL